MISQGLQMRPVRVGTILLGLLAVGAAPPDPKRIQAASTDGARIKVDGRLDEPPWRTAPVGTGFVERTPYPGRNAPVRTEFRVLYDSDTVYVGLKMFTDGVRARGWERARDNFRLFSDDAISLKFDVRLDRRTTVAFATNPAGTQLDYVAVENGDEFRREFDAVWDVASTSTDEAWIAEFAIPVIALGLPAGRSVTRIGLQVSRDDNARIATYDWTEMPPEFGPISALYYGRVEGLRGLSSGNPITLLPYALAGLDVAPGRNPTFDDVELKVGADVSARWGEDIWTELTILTDFAQVDLDDPVVNTNRFPLFFPERRPFFLSGVEVFGFGAQGFSQIFFSRRIGLNDGGQTVPLLTGFKSYGSQGDFRFGILQVLTDEQDDTPARSYTVARVRQNFGERGHVGALATLQGRVPFLTEDRPPFEPNISVGGDAAFRAFGRRLEMTGFFAGTFNAEGESTQGTSGQATVAYRGKNLQPTVSVSFVSEDFDPMVGFVSRRNLLQSQVDLDTVFRPEGSGIQQISASVEARIDQQLSNGDVLGQRAEGSLEISLRNGLEAGVSLARIDDFVREAFTLLDRIDIASDRYVGDRFEAYVLLNSTRNPYFELGYVRDSSLFGGLIQTVDAFVGLNVVGYVRTELGGTTSWVDFDGFETIRTSTFNGKVSVTPSTKLVIDLISQANTFEQRVTGLVRVRWRYLPGSDLFFVYRETIPYEDSTIEANRSLTLKLNYRFDTLL